MGGRGGVVEGVVWRDKNAQTWVAGGRGEEAGEGQEVTETEW